MYPLKQMNRAIWNSLQFTAPVATAYIYIILTFIYLAKEASTHTMYAFYNAFDPLVALRTVVYK